MNLFGMFCDLNRGRGSGGFGPASLSWQTLDAWLQRKLEHKLIDFEVDMLFELDGIYLTIATEKAKKPEEPNRK